MYEDFCGPQESLDSMKTFIRARKFCNNHRKPPLRKKLFSKRDRSVSIGVCHENSAKPCFNSKQGRIKNFWGPYTGVSQRIFAETQNLAHQTTRDPFQPVYWVPQKYLAFPIFSFGVTLRPTLRWVATHYLGNTAIHHPLHQISGGARLRSQDRHHTKLQLL